MKNLKSLQAVALAGVAAALMTGCSSTESGRAGNDSTDRAVAYQWAGSSGWQPITDVRYLGMFPQEWAPVSYESYRMAVPVSDGDTTVAVRKDSRNRTVTARTDARNTSASVSTQGFNESLEPGDTFVEAAGANSDASVKRVILYNPFRAGTPTMSR